MKLKYNIIVLIFNLFFCQSEYQILTIPKNVFQLSTNSGMSSLINNYNYSNPATFLKNNKSYNFNIIHFPADITIYNFSKSKYSISFLDYGTFESQANDISYDSFSAYEIMVQHYYTQKLKNHIFGFSTGLFYSSIDNYNSLGLSNSIGWNSFFKKINLSLGISIENFGHIFKSYTAFNQKLPLRYRISFSKNIKNLYLGYDLLYLKQSNDLQHILGLQLIINNKMTIRLSNTNNYKDLWLNDNLYNFISGLGFGIDISLNKSSINIGFLNLGVAGMVYGTSITFFDI